MGSSSAENPTEWDGRLPIITLDVPPKELHPNKRAGGWKAAGAIKKRYRERQEEFVWAYVQEKFGGVGPQLQAAVIGLHYFFNPPSRGGFRRHDPDNLVAWAKSAIDSLQNALVLANDREVCYLPPRQSCDLQNLARLEIHIRPGTIRWRDIWPDMKH